MTPSFERRAVRQRRAAAIRGGPLGLLGYLMQIAAEKAGDKPVARRPRLPYRLRQLLRWLEAKSFAIHPAAPGRTMRPEPRRAIIVSHELNASGAPKVVVEIARILCGWGCEVLVVSGADGPFRNVLQTLGVAVVVQHNLFDNGRHLKRLARHADAVILNTAVSVGLAARIACAAPCYIYLHEISSLQDRRRRGDRELIRGLQAAKAVWAGDRTSANVICDLRPDVRVIPYGFDPAPIGDIRDPLRLPLVATVFGSYEPRKGQDLAMAAVTQLPAERQAMLTLRMYGRVLDTAFWERLKSDAAGRPGIEIMGELDYDGYIRAMAASDIVLVPSRDDTLPLVSLDALSGGRTLVCTGTTGTSSYLSDGVNGFVAEKPVAFDIAHALTRAIDAHTDVPRISRAAREVFACNFSRPAFEARLAAELDFAVESDARRNGDLLRVQAAACPPRD